MLAGLRLFWAVKTPQGRVMRRIEQARQERNAEIRRLAATMNPAAIAEQYIEGREIYVGVLGNTRLRVLPVWELQFQNMAEGDWLIATEKVKHDTNYQERRGIKHEAPAGFGGFDR